MFDLSINMILQYLAVIIILIVAVIFVLKKVRRYNKRLPHNDNCVECGLYESCVRKEKKSCTETNK